MKQLGFFWHVHHEILLEWCYDYDERVRHIRTQKLPGEQDLRLRLFQPVEGRLPQELVEAWNAHDEAWKASEEAWNACRETDNAYYVARNAYYVARSASNKAWWKVFSKVWWQHRSEVRKARDGAREASEEAGIATDEAFDAHGEARNAYAEAAIAADRAIANHKDEIETLHTTDCLDCPWNGETIFTAA